MKPLQKKQNIEADTVETMVKTVVMNNPFQDRTQDEMEEEFGCLELIRGPASLMGLYWKIDQAKLNIGRSRFCQVHIPDSSVSKHHLTARLLKDGRIGLTDHKSTNGTYINEQQLIPEKEHPLNDNDLIIFGNITLKFLNRSNPEIPSVKDNFKRSYTDSLTGVGNRRLLTARAPDMFLHSQKNDQALSVIVFDIDHFKKVNDQYGHLAGDYILKEIAQLSRACFRSQDLFVRSGGEEFCIVLDSSIETAKSSVQRMRKKIANHIFKYEDTVIPVTVSAGAAMRSSTDENWKTVYERADKALYKAKNTGRNKVCLLSS